MKQSPALAGLFAAGGSAVADFLRQFPQPGIAGDNREEPAAAHLQPDGHKTPSA